VPGVVGLDRGKARTGGQAAHLIQQRRKIQRLQDDGVGNTRRLSGIP
jgi:hypothetical protein